MRAQRAPLRPTFSPARLCISACGEFEFAELPKTISGKIRRVELRQGESRLRTGEGRASNEFWEEDFPELCT